MNWILAIATALAVFRITHLVVADTFPPIVKIRNWFIERWPDEGTIVIKGELISEVDENHLATRKYQGRTTRVLVAGDNWFVLDGHWFGELISCPWCISFWIAAVASAVVFAAPTAALYIAAPFALSAVAGIISEKV